MSLQHTAPPQGSSASPVSVAMLAGSGAVVMLYGALAAAYLSFRAPLGGTLLDPGMTFDNYAAVMSVFTMLVASFAAAWAATSARIGKPRWAATGFGLACILGAAALNLVWFIAKELDLAVAASPYTVLLFSLLLLGGLAIVGGIVVSLLGLAGSRTGHTPLSNPAAARALALGQHAATAAWVLTFIVVFLKK